MNSSEFIQVNSNPILWTTWNLTQFCITSDFTNLFYHQRSSNTEGIIITTTVFWKTWWNIFGCVYLSGEQAAVML